MSLKNKDYEKRHWGPNTVDWDKELGISEDKLKEDYEADKLAAESGEFLLQDIVSSQAEAEEIARQSLDFLAGLAMPANFVFLFPPILKAAWELLVTNVDKRKNFPQIALGIPRGHAKTTTMKLFILYCILFTDIQFILVVCANESNAVNVVADIKDMLQEPNIKQIFGDWKVGIEIDRQDLKKFGFRGRNIVLAAIGSNGSLRGINIKNARPELMLFDDVQTKECSESPSMSEALERWIIGTAMKAKSPRGCMFVFSGNMYPGPNSILKKLKSNPTWIKFISGAILIDGTALWPELRSIESLIKELDNDIAMGHPEIFFSEVLNDTDAGINTTTDLSLLRDWPWEEFEQPQGKFIVIDPAPGTAGKVGDAVSIGLFYVYDELPALREIVEEHLSPGNTIRKTLLMAIRNNVKVIAVESNSYQGTLLYWFAHISEQLGITGFHFVEVYTGATSKNGRISAMLKSLTSGEIILHPDVKSKVTNQISNWNPLKRVNTDGILDVLTYTYKVMELYGNLISTEEDLLVSAVADGIQMIEFDHAF